MNVRNSNKAIIVRDGCLLVIVNEDSSGKYFTLPGGGQEFGETIPVGLIRECREETGLEVKVGELAFIRDYIGSHHDFAEIDKNVHQVELMFLCDIAEDSGFGKGIVPDTWQIGLEWLEIGRLNEYRLYPEALKKLIPRIGKEKLKIYLGDAN